MGEQTVQSGSPSRLGKYTVVELIGEGSMGKVFLGRDPALERDVAIKVMAGSSLRDERMRERFEREAKSIARLHHPNIVTVHDLGYDAHGLPFIAMELLRGKNLEELIEEGSLRLDRKLDVAVQVCRGLAHAHRNGIIHRDVKPPNIFVAEDGTAKITDFGVARWTQTTRTQSGLVVGTAGYMSPEQLRGRAVDGRTDLFSLGVVLYELLTHQLLFGGDTLETIFFKTLSRDVPKLVLPDGSEPTELQEILERALARDPHRRFRTAEEMGDALERAAASTRARFFGPETLGVVEPSTPAGSRAGRESPRRRSSQPTLRLPRPPRTAQAPRPERSRASRRPSTGAGRRTPPRRTPRILALSTLLALSIVALGTYLLLALRPGGSASAPDSSAPTELVRRPPKSAPEAPAEDVASSILADAALALAAGDLSRTETLVERGKRLAPHDPRWTSLDEQLGARKAQAERGAKAARHVASAEQRLAEGDYDGAIEGFKSAMTYDPASSGARSGLDRAMREKQEAEREALRAEAAAKARTIAETQTEYLPPEEGEGELLGFEPETGLDVKETAEPFYPAQLVIELDPADARPGEPYVIRVGLFNEGYGPLGLRELSLVSVFGGKTSGRGQSLPLRVSEVAPRATVTIYEASGTWKENYASGRIEAIVTVAGGGLLRKSIDW